MFVAAMANDDGLTVVITVLEVLQYFFMCASLSENFKFLSILLDLCAKKKKV